MKPLRIAPYLVALATLGSLNAYAANIPLYPTGPAEDSSFIRFINANPDGQLQVKAAGSNAVLELTPAARASAYMPVAGKSKIEGELKQGSVSQKVQVQMQPGEFVTVLGMDTPQGLQAIEVREEGDGFTAVRASIAFYDLNPDCKNAAVQIAGRNVALFENVEVGKWVRRQINPVPLSVQLLCAGQATGPALDLGTLQAGERHSLFLVPGDPAKSFLHIKDTVAN